MMPPWEAGAQFVISGCTAELLQHARQQAVPLIPVLPP